MKSQNLEFLKVYHIKDFNSSLDFFGAIVDVKNRIAVTRFSEVIRIPNDASISETTMTYYDKNRIIYSAKLVIAEKVLKDRHSTHKISNEDFLSKSIKLRAIKNEFYLLDDFYDNPDIDNQFLQDIFINHLTINPVFNVNNETRTIELNLRISTNSQHLEILDIIESQLPTTLVIVDKKLEDLPNSYVKIELVFKYNPEKRLYHKSIEHYLNQVSKELCNLN